MKLEEVLQRDLTRTSEARSGNVSCYLSISEEVLSKALINFTVNSVSCPKTKADIYRLPIHDWVSPVRMCIYIAGNNVFYRITADSRYILQN